MEAYTVSHDLWTKMLKLPSDGLMAALWVERAVSALLVKPRDQDRNRRCPVIFIYITYICIFLYFITYILYFIVLYFLLRDER